MALAFELRRPDDLLNLRVEASNLRLDTSNLAQPALVVEKPDQAAYLTFVFPPQTIAEPAYFESSKVKPADEGSNRKDLDVATPDEVLDPPGLAQGKHRTTAQLGHPSRLVFKVPADARIPFSMDGLLDWSKLELAVNPIAAIGASPTADQIAKAPTIQPPAANETAIELPYRLVISPTADVAWEQRGRPFTSRGRTEMWNTRLALKTPGGITELSRDHPASLRAIWSYDYRPEDVPDADEKDPDLDRTAMSANDRHQIVVLTSAFHGYEVELDFNLYLALPFVNRALGGAAAAGQRLKLTVPYVPEPFEAEQMMLSPLGGWLRSRGHWTPPHTAPPILRRPIDSRHILKWLEPAHPVAGAAARNLAAELAIIGRAPAGVTQLDLSEWVHVATLGRDHYVRIVYEGELWPFRHRAALIKVTERKFMEANGIVGAYPMQHMFIVVREPMKAFARDDRGNPLKNVRLTTLVTPDIADPDEPGSAKVPGTDRSFWVQAKTSTGAPVPFSFHGVGTDVGGNNVDFTVPLMFVSLSDLQTKFAQVTTEYNREANRPLRKLGVPGQKLLFAEPDPDPGKANDNTQLVTQTLSFVVDPAGNPPKLDRAEVKIKQVQELLGTDGATTIAFYDNYVKNGFDARTGVFAKIVDPSGAMAEPKLRVDFTADKAGGFATPNLGVTTLTRGLGPMAGKVDNAVSDSFDPTTFFPKGEAQLFGCFDLSDLLLIGSLSQNAPKMSTKTQDVPGGRLITATLDWEPAVQSHDLVIAAFEKDHNGVSQLKVHALIQKVVTLAGAPADGVKAEVMGVLTNFQVSVLKSVFINFTEFSLHTRSGEKPDVKVKLDAALPVEFGGDLTFVEELRKAIPPDLFGTGPSLDISLSGVRAGFAFALPPLAIGVFALKDVNLGAALTLPFVDGKPVFDFNVSERHHPFLLTVALFGGGGFFHLQLDTAGMKALEAALEFGAAAAIDIGVASGEVHIMAGIYFSLQRKEGGTELIATLGGYLRMGGSLCVLGLIKVSVEFNLTFAYDSGPDKAYGRATLTVCVEVAFFSKSVDLTVERAFGGHGDPKFGDLVTTPAMWNAYALAFA